MYILNCKVKLTIKKWSMQTILVIQSLTLHEMDSILKEKYKNRVEGRNFYRIKKITKKKRKTENT